MSRRLTGFIITALCGALVLAATSRTVFADAAEARKHYQKGVTAYNLQRFSVALEEFQAAYSEKQDPVFLYNIGQTQRNLGQYDAAAKSYRAFLNQAPDIEGTQRSEVERLIKQMDDAARDERAKQPPTGTQPPTTTPAVEPSTPPVITAPTAAMPTPTTREANDDELHAARTKRIAGLAVGGFGIVSLALGGVFTGLASDANHHIVTGDRWSSSTEDRRNTYQALDVAFFSIGGAAVVAGAVLYLIGRHDAHKRYPIDRAQLAPVVGSRVAGLNLVGSF